MVYKYDDLHIIVNTLYKHILTDNDLVVLLVRGTIITRSAKECIRHIYIVYIFIHNIIKIQKKRHEKGKEVMKNLYYIDNS